MKRVYRSSQGKPVDLGALLLQNETVRAVGNMGVNARGDRIDIKNKVIDTKVKISQRAYNKQIGPQDGIPQASVAPDPRALQEQNAKEQAVFKEQRKAQKNATKAKNQTVKATVPTPATTPTPPPAGRKTKRKPKLYDTIDPRTGKPSGKKVSASRHLANIDAFKKREKEGTVMTEAEAKRGDKAGKRVMEILGFTKKNKGSSDMRKGGMVISTVDNRRKK